jgi:hypothetical protein
MKKMFLISLFSFLSISSFSQKVRFSDSSNVWNCLRASSGGLVPPIFSPFSDYYKNDTVIRGTKYKQLWDNFELQWVFIREDTIMKKVFAIEPFYFTDTTEKLLYDYTLRVGDTFKTDHGAYYVNNIDSVMVNMVWHKVWYLFHDSITSYPFVETIIEGIGSISEPCSPIRPLDWMGEAGNFLTCFHSEGSTPPISPPFGPYYLDISSHPFYFDNTTSCTYDFLGIKMLSSKNPDVTLFPNPVQSELFINSTNAINTIYITNLIGQNLYTHEYNSQQVQVEFSDLPAGIYLIRINGTEVRKFVKQ